MLVQSPSTQAEGAVAALVHTQQPLLEWLTRPTVTNPDEQRNAENLLISAKLALNHAQEARKDLTRPLDDSKARIIALFKPYITRLEQGIATLNHNLTTYRTYLLELQRAEEERAMLANAERLRQAEATGEVVDPATIEPPDVPVVARTSRANLGTVTYREDFDIHIVDPYRVPRDLCEPSLSKIRARVKSGVTKIPGVLVTPKQTTIARKGGESS